MTFEHVRAVLGPKRTLQVLQTVAESGPVRFNELNASLDTSSATLSESLETLVRYDLLYRDEENERRVSYESTAFGRNTLRQIRELESELEAHDSG